MARTTQARVVGVLNRDYDYVNNPLMDPYISAANTIVSNLVTEAGAQGVGISSAQAEEVETWVAAYLYTVSDAVHTSRSNAGASASFLRTQENSYLAAAKMIDPTGLLQEVLSPNRVRGFWLGRPPSEQTDYVDRD